MSLSYKILHILQCDYSYKSMASVLMHIYTIPQTTFKAVHNCNVTELQNNNSMLDCHACQQGMAKTSITHDNCHHKGINEA